jgi:hypothetical protein
VRLCITGSVHSYTEKPVALNPTIEPAFGFCDKHSFRYFISCFEILCMRYKLECVFMYDPFINRGSARMKRFQHKFYNTTVPYRITLDETVNKLK